MCISILFRENVQRAFESSSFDSFRQASLAAKMSEPQVQQIINGKFDNSPNGPGVFAISRLAKVLGTTVSRLLGDEAKAAIDPGVFNGTSGPRLASTDDLLARHWRSGGRVEAFEDILDYCDLYGAPSDKPNLICVGAHSLMGMRLQSTDRDSAQEELDALDAKKTANIVDFHRKTLGEGWAVDCTHFDHQLQAHPLHVRASYSRLGLCVTDADGRKLVLVRCIPIPV